MLPWLLVSLPWVTLNSGPQAKLALRKSVLICLPSEAGLDPEWGFLGGQRNMAFCSSSHFLLVL